MHFTLVVSEYKYHISIPRNLTYYKWCGTKVAHCTYQNLMILVSKSNFCYNLNVCIRKIMLEFEFDGPFDG